jgi:catalase
VVVIAPHAGTVGDGGSGTPVDKPLYTAKSVELDAVVVGDVAPRGEAADQTQLNLLLGEAYRHLKPIAAWGGGRARLEEAGIPEGAPGVVVGDAANREFARALKEAVGMHRQWDRSITT